MEKQELINFLMRDDVVLDSGVRLELEKPSSYSVPSEVGATSIVRTYEPIRITLQFSAAKVSSYLRMRDGTRYELLPEVPE